MASPTDGLLPPSGGGAKSNYSSKKVLQEINAETLKWKKNLLDVEKTMQRIYATWSKMYGGRGKLASTTGSGTSGPGGFAGLDYPGGGAGAALTGVGSNALLPGAGGRPGINIEAETQKIMARLDQFKIPKTGLDYGLAIAGGAARTIGFGMGLLPNTMDAVNQRIMTQGVATLTGQNYQGLINQSNKLGGSGITGSYSMQGAMVTLSQAGILPTMSKSYNNMMGEIGGLSAITGMGNEQVAQGMAAINNNNFIRLGMRARNPDGSLRPVSELANDLMRRMYPGQKPTVENIMQGFRPGSKAYADVMAAAGGDANLANTLLMTMAMQAKNGGKKLNLKDAKQVMDKYMHLPADDPLRKILKAQTSEARVLQATGKGLTQGFGAALDTQTAVNNGFSRLAEVLPGVVDNLGRLKGFLDTLPQAGNAGGTVAGALGGLAHTAGNIFSTYMGLRMAGKAASAVSRFLGFGAEAAAAGAAAETGIAAGAAATAAGVAGAEAAAGGAIAATGAAATVAGTAGAAGAAGTAAAAATGATAVGIMAKLKNFARFRTFYIPKHAKPPGPGFLSRLAPYAADAAIVGAGVMATNWAVPALRRWGARHGIKEHSALDNFGTTLGYMGGYAAAGASRFGAAGAVAGTVIGLGRGLAYTVSGMKPNEHTKEFLRRQMEMGIQQQRADEGVKWQHDHGYLEADPDTGGDTGLPSTMIKSVLRQAGFGPKGQEIGLAIARAESGGNPHAHNTDASTGDNSYGLFQINMIGSMGPTRRKQFGLSSNDDLFDPLTNAKAAYAISNKGTNWNAWSTFKSGAYRQYMYKHSADSKNDSHSVKNKVTRANAGRSGGYGSPADGPITADYGQKPKNNTYWKWKGYHTGRDYGVKSGSAVKAFKEGVVKYAGKGQGLSGAGEPYGNIVVVDHGGYQSMYAHLLKSTVKAGQHVKAGEQIALSGQSGSGAAAGPHLHFEIRKGKFPNSNETDPRPYLSGAIGNNKGFLDSVKSGVGSVVSGVEKALQSVWHTAASAFGMSNSSGKIQAPGPAGQFGRPLQVSAVNSDWTSFFGGDTGAPVGGSSSMASNNGVVINMNVTVNGTSINDARKFANDVKNLLEKDLRTAKIGTY